MKLLTRTKESVIFHLLKAVFIIYFAFTLTLTVSHMLLEYNNTKNAISRELALVQESFSSSLSTALFELNEVQIQAIINGMVQLPSVTGVSIETTGENFSMAAALGTVIEPDGRQVLIENDLKTDSQQVLFWQDFPIYYHDSDLMLGKGRIYSSTSVVYAQVKDIFIIIIGSAILKTAALWILFLWAARSHLNRPITVLSNVMQRLDFDAPESLEVSIKPAARKGMMAIGFNIRNKLDEQIEVHRNDEIHQMASSFSNMNNSMLRKLQSLHLLNELGENLSRAKNTAEVFEQVFRITRQKYYIDQALVFLEQDPHHFRLNYLFGQEQASGIGSTVVKEHLLDRAAARGLVQVSNLAVETLPGVEGISGMRSLMSLVLSDESGSLACLLFIGEANGFELRADDQVFFETMSRLILVALNNLRMLQTIQDYGLHLEEQVAQRTSELSNAKEVTEKTLQRLQETQKTMIQQEKMAALGGLVAGVAHEINTPVGIVVTSASSLTYKTEAFSRLVHSNEPLSRKELENYLTAANDSSHLIQVNIERAANLIDSFKQVAVDQTNVERRQFLLRHYVEQVLKSLGTRLSKSPHHVKIDIPEKLAMDTYPGPLSQILTNLIMNSLIHGFTEQPGGEIRITAIDLDAEVCLTYEDNGQGMKPEHIARIFEPFFTTKRNAGGIGLGMHIVYNLVTSTLGGNIECESEPGKGTCFTMRLPKFLPSSDSGGI